MGVIAVEIASAYVTLLPSFRGGAAAIASELGAPLERASKDAGESSGKGFASSFGTTAKRGMAAAGVGIGAGLAAGFASNLNFGQANDKLAAQLGTTGAKSKELGKVAGSLYAGAYGDSLGQVNQAIAGVTHNIDGIAAAGSPALQKVAADVLNLAQTFDQDVNGVTAAAGQLLKTGLAASATEAFDIITVGFQRGADKSGDLLDTLNEYGTQFRNFGLNGAQATGLISQGLAAGGRSADLVADSIKEFSIRAVDGSKLTAEGFASIGLNAGAMAARIAQGGQSANAALDETLDRLRAIPDPVQRSQAAVALFGTQAEDLGQALFALDPSKAVAGLGKLDGAAARVGATLSDNAATGIEKFRRTLEVRLAGVADAFGPVLAAAPALGGLVQVGDKIGPALGKAASGARSLAGGLASAASGAASSIAAGARVVAITLAQGGAFVAQKAAMIGAALAQKVLTAGQWLLNAALTANPIGLVVAGVAALAAAAVYAYRHFEPFRQVVDAVGRALRDGLGAAVSWVTDTAIPALVGFASTVSEKIGQVIGFVASIPGRITEAVGNLGGALVDAGKALVGGLLDGLKAAFGLVKAFYVDMPLAILRFLGDTALTLVDKGRDLIGGLIAGMKAQAAAVLDFFRGLFRGVADIFTTGWRALQDITQAGARFILDKILAMSELVVKGADAAFGWVPGVGPKLAEAANGVEAFRDQVNAALGGVTKSVTPTVTPTMDEVALAGIRNRLRSAFLDENAPIIVLPGGIKARAHGGPVSPGQAYLVGENGPELVVPRWRAYVLPNASAPVGAGGGRSGFTMGDVNVSAGGDPNDTARAIVRELRTLAYLAG